MGIHLHRDLEDLTRKLFEVGTMVEQATNDAIESIIDRRADLANHVLQGDMRIDQLEVEVENDALKILALHQPVAIDLRFIVAVLKMNNDLERMGDLAVNIAERAKYLATHPKLDVRLHFREMGSVVRQMVRDCLDALTQRDPALARAVCARDDEVDRFNSDMYLTLRKHMLDDGESIKRAIHLLSVARHLERIADLATNIAEDVVFMVEGEVIRHQVEEYD